MSSDPNSVGPDVWKFLRGQRRSRVSITESLLLDDALDLEALIKARRTTESKPSTNLEEELIARVIDQSVAYAKGILAAAEVVDETERGYTGDVPNTTSDLLRGISERIRALPALPLPIEDK